MSDVKIPKIAKEGYPFILIFVIVTIIGFMISSILGCALTALTVWCILFFRDPERITPQKEGLIIAPADGVVQKIGLSMPPPDLKNAPQEEMLKVSIFMNVFNVHINRTPIDATIKEISYFPGKFFNASLDKASEKNERQSFLLETNEGTNIVMVQIAGLVARRIVKFVNPEATVKAGEKVGMIRFGSRVDLYLPKDSKLSVIEGQITIGGETVITDLKNTLNNEEPLTGKVLDRPISN